MAKENHSVILQKFALWIGADCIHDQDGTFIKMEHNHVSRMICQEYRLSGSSAWIAFCHQNNIGDRLTCR